MIVGVVVCEFVADVVGVCVTGVVVVVFERSLRCDGGVTLGTVELELVFPRLGITGVDRDLLGGSSTGISSAVTTFSVGVVCVSVVVVFCVFVCCVFGPVSRLVRERPERMVCRVEVVIVGFAPRGE